MAIVVTLVGVVIVALGAAIALSPSYVIGWISALSPQAMYWTAVLVRVAIGVAFLVAAPGCRLPVVVQVLGWLTLVGAVIILILGPRRLDAFVAWWLGRPRPFLRGWGIVSVGVGALIVYAGA